MKRMSLCTESSQNEQVDGKDATELGKAVKNGVPVIESTSQHDHLELILKTIRAHEGYFGVDEEGRPVIQYKEPIQLNWEQSRANMVAKEKEGSKVDECTEAVLELIDYFKKLKLPSGNTLDSTKACPSNSGNYREDHEFEVTKRILGKGKIAGNKMVIKDKSTGSENALKTVMITAFRTDEIRAWVTLSDEEFCPSLYLFKLEGNKIHMHMEKLEDAITLDDIINEHMGQLSDIDPSLVRPFSLCIFYDLLDIVEEMNSKGWTHRDLHAGNIMVQKKDEHSMKIRVLDFGKAIQYNKDGLEDFRTDIIEVIQKFSALYTGVEFDVRAVQQNLKQKTLLMTGESNMSEEDRFEIFHLIDSALKIVDPSGIKHLKDDVQQKLKDLNVEKDKLMRNVIKILFPKEGIKVSNEDAIGGGDGNVMDSEEPDLLQYFRRQLCIGRFK